MNNSNFSMLVKKYFHYLTDEFHYSVVEKPSNGKPDYGVVEFQSALTIVHVVRQEDRPTDVVYIVIKPLDAPDDVEMSLKRIVDGLGIKVDLPDDYVPPQYLEDVLKKYAREMRKYCLEFIQGDFSKWDLILRHYIEDMRNWYKSMVKEDLPKKTRYQVIVDYIKAKEKEKTNKSRSAD